VGSSSGCEVGKPERDRNQRCRGREDEAVASGRSTGNNEEARHLAGRGRRGGQATN